MSEETTRVEPLIDFVGDSEPRPAADDRCFSPSAFGVDDDDGVDDDIDVVLEVEPLVVLIASFDELSFSSCENVVGESAAGLSSDVGHAADVKGADGCSNMLNQGCWRHSFTVRRSLRTNKSSLLGNQRVQRVDRIFFKTFPVRSRRRSSYILSDWQLFRYSSLG